MKFSKFQSRFQLNPSLKNQVPIENFKVLEELLNDCERDIKEPPQAQDLLNGLGIFFFLKKKTAIFYAL